MPGESVEDLLKTIRDKLTELEDMQLVNKLDIINMKNELDKIGLTSATSPDAVEKMESLSRLLEKSDRIKKIERAYEDIEKVKSQIEKAKPPDSGAMEKEIDSLRKKVSELESAGPVEAGGAVPPELLKRVDRLEKSMSAGKPGRAPPPLPLNIEEDIADLRKKVADLGKKGPSGPGPQPSLASLDNLQKIMTRIEDIEKRRIQAPAKGGKAAPAVPASLIADIALIKTKVADLEKRPSAPAKVVQPPPGPPPKSGEIQALKADISSLRSMIESQPGKKVGKGKPAKGMVLPSDFSKRIRAIEKSVEKLDSMKPGIRESKAMLASLQRDVAKLLGQPSGMPAEEVDAKLDAKMQEVRASIEEQARAELSKLQQDVASLAQREPGLPADEVDAKLDAKMQEVKASVEAQSRQMLDLHNEEGTKIAEYASKVEDMVARLDGMQQSADKEDLDDLRKDVQILSASIPKGIPQPEKLNAMLAEFDDLKSRIAGIERVASEGRAEAGSDDRLQSFANEINGLKEKLAGMEQTVAGAGMAPAAMEELKRMKGRFPVEEFVEMKSRMEAMEKALEKTSKLAAGLQPIEMPEKGGHPSKGPPDLEKRISQLQKAIHEAPSAERLSDLESRIEDMRSKMSSQVEQGTEKKLGEFKADVDSRLSKLQDLKRGIIESSMEQLLAQPGNVSKFIDDKLRRDVQDMKERVEKMDKRIGPVDAKMAAVLRESDDKDREMDKLKESIKEVQDQVAKNHEELNIEVKAMNSKLSTTSTSVKGMESAGTPGIMRDLEILKTKAEWLESTVQKFDLNPVYEKLQELETRLRAVGAGSSVASTGGGGGYSAPLVIE